MTRTTARNANPENPPFFYSVRKGAVGAVGAALIAALSACGGGGNSGDANPPSPGASVTLAAAQTQTLAGGKALPLTATATGNGAVTWTLAAGAPGSLSAATGASVNYVPPATAGANMQATVNASAGGASASLTLTVFPQPGAPGLSLISGRFNPATQDGPVDGPAAAARFRLSERLASDLSGNLYVAGTCQLSSSRRSWLTLRKIGTDNTVSTLASCESDTWFGRTDTDRNTVKVYQPRGLAIDRAGNIYVSTYFISVPAGVANSGSGAVFKITPQGVMTTFAGADGPHTTALLDGKGGAARFLTPKIAGIDAEDNLYVRDKDDTVVRKITPAGEVSTVATLPASLTADLNGNTYRADYATGAIVQVTPAGVESTIANVRALEAGSSVFAEPYGLVRTGPATYALIARTRDTFPNEIIVKLVVPH